MISDRPALRFFYGTIEKNIDITDTVFNKFYFDTYVVIPADDNVRAKMFTDPCFKIVKHVFVIGMTNNMRSFDHATDIIIDTRTNNIISDIEKIRKLIMMPFTDPEKKVRNLHRYIQLDGGSMQHELPEQCMIAQFLSGNEKVLEIGGNIGRGSMVIASILTNGADHVVLESSENIANILKRNRDRNGFKFHVESATLSARKLIQKGWTTIPSDIVLEGYEPVNILSYSDLKAKYNIEFDTLVLDCEGAFYYIVNDFPEILQSIRTIIVKNDYQNKAEKLNIDARLIENGFSCAFVREREEAKQSQFSLVENFYEVWKKEVVSNIEPVAPTRLGGKFMDLFPCVLFYRHDKYKSIDSMFQSYSGKIECSIKIVDNISDLHLMFDSNYPILVTYGENEKEYTQNVNSAIADRMRKRWIHFKTIESVEKFVEAVNYCYIDVSISERVSNRVVFSLFTTCYNSYDKIDRAYKSILAQTFRDWEWVILDDSPDDKHFSFLRKKFLLDKRVRLFKRSHNSGNIGNVKNEAVSLCRGAYVLEMDHDDEILPEVLADAVRTFQENPDVGFVYMDFINVYENFKNFWYGDFICKGYGGYYMQKYNNKWVEVYITPNVNNVTLSHIVCLPNHPRIWRKETILKLGNYSEFLPICDDQELLMHTALHTKMAKLPKLGYVQYMNDNNNNFSLLRNREINRLGPKFIVPQFYAKYKINEKMKEIGAYENEEYIIKCSPIWKRENHTHLYCNKRIQYDYDTQYCIIGVDTFMVELERLKELYKNPRNDFILLDGSGDKDRLCKVLDNTDCSRMKCYSMPNTPTEQLLRYFHVLYKSCENSVVLDIHQSVAPMGDTCPIIDENNSSFAWKKIDLI